MESGKQLMDALTTTYSLEPPPDSGETLRSLAGAAISVILENQTEESALSGPPFDSMDINFIKVAYSSLICLLVEATRRDSSLFLKQDCGLSDPVAEVLVRIFEENKGDLRSFLLRTADHSSIARISGLDWRIERDEGGGEVSYILDLKTVGGETGEVGKVEFGCSVEELQHLLASLKDACRSVERLASSS